MNTLVECVPNFSEGRDAGKVEAIIQALLDGPEVWLLDREMDNPVTAEIRDAVADVDHGGSTRIADLHLWRVGKARFACILSLVTHDAEMTPDRVKARLREHVELAHVTVEVNRCS